MSTNEFRIGPNRVRILIDSEPFGLVEGSFQPNIPGPAPHRHEWDESFYVVSGRLRVIVDGDELVLEPGDFAMAASGQTHTFGVAGHEPAVFIATFGPTGVEYIRDMADVFTSAGPDPEKLAALHSRYGVTTS